jgi:Tol biopolymer transport system component
MADIFVSYSATDRHRIEPLVAVLQKQGWSVWWDRDLVAGPSFDEKIEEALESARCVVVAWSSSSVQSRWVRAEANEGLERRILVPLKLEEVRPPLAFRSSQTASLVDWPADPGELNKLISGVEECLASPARPPEPEQRSKSIIEDPSVNAPRPPWLKRSYLGIALITAIFGVGLALYLASEGPHQDRSDDMDLLSPSTLPVQLTAYPPAESLVDAAISPDGKFLAFIRDSQLYLLTIDTRETHRVTLDWSRYLSKVTWSPDGTILYLISGDRTLWSVSPFGGRPRYLLDRAEVVAASANGRLAIIRTSESGRSRSSVWLMESDGSQITELLSAGTDESYWQLAWIPSGAAITVGIFAVQGDTGMGDTSVEIRLENLSPDNGDRFTLLEEPELFQNWTAVLPFTWCGEDRLIVGRRDGPTHQVTSNLWMAKAGAGQNSITDRRRLTQWVASNIRAISASDDCSQIAVMRSSNQLDVYVTEMMPQGVSATKQITFDERQDMPVDWHPDGQRLLFASSRSGSWELFEQNVDGSGSAIRWPTPGGIMSATYVLDGEWIAYVGNDAGIFRVARDGGSPHPVLEGKFDRVQCVPRTSVCVASRLTGTAITFTRLDLLTGESKQQAQTEHRQPFTNWALSEDGHQIAIVHNDNNEIKIVDLRTNLESTIVVDGWRNFEFVGWVPDGNAVVVNASPVDAANPGGFHPGLIRVTIDGKASFLNRAPNEWYVLPKPGPDGVHVAYAAMKFHSNAWLIELPTSSI